MTDREHDGVGLLKASCLLTRKAGLTHWTEKHTPMLANPVPGSPKVYRYVQLHPIPETVPALKTAPNDGVA